MSTSTASRTRLRVDLGLQPKQEELLDLIDDSPFTDIGYGGRRGGGKSGGMRRVLIFRRLKYANTTGVILRRTLQELNDNHLVPLLREFPYMRDWYLAKDKALIFPNGSRLLFRYAEHEKDVEKLFGSEYGDICAEEAGLFTERELQMMKGSNRDTSGSRMTPKMLYSFMPGGASHFYLKRVFVDREYEPGEDGNRFAFLEAYGWDNVEWCRSALIQDGLTAKEFYDWPDEVRKAYFLERSDYAGTLLSISDPGLRAAWLEGSWERFEGIVFPELSDKVHNLDNFRPGYTGGSLAKFVSAVDWADTGTVAATETSIEQDEFLCTLDEYSEEGRLISEHTADVLALFKRYGNQAYTLMDLPVNNISQKDLLSIQDAFRRAGLRTSAAHRAHIEMGLNLLKEYLKVDPELEHPFTGEMGSPRLFISRARCPNLWRQMAQLQRAIDKTTGKVTFIGEDHALDTLRYTAMSRPKPKTKPVGMLRTEAIGHIADPTAKHIAALRFNDMQKKKSAPIVRKVRFSRN